MNVFLIILAAIGFVGGQVFLLFCLYRLDRYMKDKPSKKSNFTYDDSYRYPDEDVVE